MADSQASLVQQVRFGGNRRLLHLAAAGLLPLPPDELIPLQIWLARGADAELAREAAKALRGLAPHLAAAFIAEAADPESLEWFALTSKEGQVLEALLRRRDVPRELLLDLAPRLSPDLQEVLLLRQDAILELPAILEGLERNPQLTAYTRRRIDEYRQHLLPREAPAAPAPGTEEAAAEAAAAEAAAAEEAAEERAAIFVPVEAEIRVLPVPERMRMARGANRALRNILIRDPNPLVALSVLEHNLLSEQEVEGIATSRLVVEEVLNEIGGRREWVARYPIMKALVTNPRTPPGIALRLMGRLNFRDLRELTRNRSASSPVRAAALRLYTMRQH